MLNVNPDFVDQIYDCFKNRLYEQIFQSKCYVFRPKHKHVGNVYVHQKHTQLNF